jgi:hypothetical protein
MSTDTIGSLVIDLRANVAQLRTDMDAVKDTIAKSSREMSSQMKSDMTETRQVLALMRDDFGVGVPRELRKVIASSELARTALLGIKDALFGLAFLNLGVEAFNKISQYVEKAQQQTEEEAKNTRDIAIAAQNAVDATLKRQEALELIGKGEEERAAIQRAFFEQEKQRNIERLKGLQSELGARLAILATYDAQAQATPDRAASAEAGIDEPSDTGHTGLSSGSLSIYAKAVQAAKPQLEALKKAIDDANAGIKTSDQQLSDYEKSLGLQRIANAKNVATARLNLEQATSQALMNLHGADLAADAKAIEDAAEHRYQVDLDALTKSIAILQQDPSRNKQQIEKDLSDIQVLWYTHQQEMVRIYADSTAKITAINDKDFGELLAMTQPTGKSGVQEGAAEFEARSKREAELGKVRKDAMDALLTPTQKYEQELVLIQSAMVGWEKFPNVMKALQEQTLLLNPEFQKLQEASAEFGKDLSNELDNLVTKGETFHQFLGNIAKDIEEIALKALLLKPLEDFFSGKGGSGGGGGITGFLGSIFSAFGGGRASGGSVSGGTPYLVGEQGPEMFMPSSSGTIVPNGSLGGDHYTVYIDAKGAAAGTEANIMRGMQALLEKNRRQSVASAIDYQRRR